MSWNPSLEPGCPDAVAVDAIETLIVPRGARPRRLRGAPGPAGAPAPDGGTLRVLRPGGPRRIHHRQGGRRAAPPAYRPRHRHLPLPRRVPAPRQHRVEPADPARRRQLDGGGAGRHPFGTDQRGDPRGAPRPVRHPDLDGAAGGPGGCGAELRAPRRGVAPRHRGRGRLGPADPRAGLRRDRAGPALLGHVLPRRDPGPPGALPASRRPRGPRALHRRGVRRHRGPGLRGRAHDGVPAGGRHHGRGRRRRGAGSSPSAARR